VHILWKTDENKKGLEGYVINGNDEKPVVIARIWKGVAEKSSASVFLRLKKGEKFYSWCLVLFSRSFLCMLADMMYLFGEGVIVVLQGV